MLLKKKIKKILFVLVAVIIAFSCCCVPASAQSVGTTITSFNQFCELDYVQIYHGVSNSDDMTHFTDYSNSYLVNNSLFVDVSGDKGFARWQVYKIVTYFKIKPAYQIEGFSEGSFLISVDDEHSNYYGFLSKTNDGLLYRADTSTGDLNRGQMEYNFFQRSTGRFVQNSTPSSYDTFWCEFYITNKVNLTEDYTFVFNFSNLNYKIMTKDEKILLTLVQNQNENADKIMQNQTENADKIMQNQNENADKILNGGSDNPHYNGADTTATDNYHATEEQINNSTSGSRSDSISFFNNFGNILSNVHLRKGLLAVSKLMTDVFAIDWLANLIQFALVLGAFSFILGMVTLVVGRVSSTSKKEARSNSYKGRN